MDKTLADIHARLDSFWIWDMEPDLLNLGPLTIRFYGVLFALGLLLGFYLWRWQMDRGGHHRPTTEKYLVWGVVAVLVGSRLGHCLFYEPEIYLKNPLKILEIWKGGLASHGATLGLILSLWLYARRYKFSFFEIIDRFAMSATMGAIFVRLGNFMNSEIVGKVWDGAWAVRFPRYAEMNQRTLEANLGHPLGYAVLPLPRHPSQLYEALGGLAVFLLLLLVDRALKEKRPRGLLAGLFLTGYFTFRFLVEFFKEFQSLASLKLDPQLHVITVTPTSGLTMGQYLSIPFILLGIVLVVMSIRIHAPASVVSPSVDHLPAEAPQATPKRKKKK